MHKQLPAQSARGTRICASKLFLLGVQFFLTGSVYAHTLQKQLLFIHIDDDGYMHSAATFASLATEGQIHRYKYSLTIRGLKATQKISLLKI